MGTRLDLHNELLEFAPNAYYQPPSSIRMKYPCFVYCLSTINTEFADNRHYKNYTKYQITFICESPADAKIVEILDHFRYCRFDRHYVADNLHHYVFELFY